MKTQRLSTLITAVFLSTTVTVASNATAQTATEGVANVATISQSKSDRQKVRQERRQERRNKFDANEDGKLSKEERKAFREARKAKRKARRKANI